MKKYFILFLLILVPASFADVSIMAPAVAETDYGYVGAPINIDVKVSNGSGHVFMDTMPMTQMDMQGSARIASKVAFDITGKNQNKYDVYYIVRSDVPVIGGPSAGATLCVATIAALNNWSINKDVMMTGMINPDGSIGPVGGILEKLKAAKSLNMKYFLIPKGERYVNAGEGLGGNNTVDVVKYGKELGITVIEVKSINDALYYFTNHRIVEKNYHANIMKENIYKNMMKSLSIKILNRTENNYLIISNRLNYESKYNPKLNYDLKVELTNDQSMAKSDIAYASELQLNKSYYASTSKAFGALITLEYINTTLNYLDSNDGNNYIKNYLLNIQKNIDYQKKHINNKKMTEDNFEYIMASKSRVYEADELMNSAWKSYYNNKPLEALKYGSYAKLRAESAIWWLNLYNYSKNYYNQYGENKTRYINTSDLKYLAQEYLDNSEVVVLYSSMVFPNAMTSEAQKNLDDAKNYYDNKEYLLSISKSIDAQVYATTSLNFMEDMGYLRNIAREKINMAEHCNDLIPVSALSYYEYAGSFNDNITKILYYKYSMAYAQMDIDIINELNNGNNSVIGLNNEFIEDSNTSPVVYSSNYYSSPYSLKNILLCVILVLSGLFCGIIIGHHVPKKNDKK